MSIFKHVFRGAHVAGDIWTTAFHSEGSQTVSEAHDSLQSDFIASVFSATTGLPTYWPTDITVAEAITYQLSPISGKAVAAVRSQLTRTGSATGDSAPPRDCLVTGLRTQVPGPGGRGRMYWPCPSLDNLTDGLIEQVALDFFTSKVSDGFEAMGLGGPLPVVWRVGAASGDTIDTITASRVPGSQRRRSNKIPANYSVTGVALGPVAVAHQHDRLQAVTAALANAVSP